MKILFDENVPAPLRRFFPNDEVVTVQELGWSGVENGELITRAEGRFDVLLLADKNMKISKTSLIDGLRWLSSRRIAGGCCCPSLMRS